MISKLRSRGALLAATAVLAGCGGAEGTASVAGSTSPTRAPAPSRVVAARQPVAATAPQPVAATAGQPASAVLATRRPITPSVAVHAASGYGRLLVDGQGRTLYLFTADRGRASACRGACAAAWPPLIVKGVPRAGPGISGSRLSVVRRDDGQLQLAYFGHPLYRYLGDRQPGQINCQDAEEYGGHWWLVAPGGQPNRSSP